MAKLHDVAREAGVSLAAASLAVNGKPGVSDETRVRVGNVARALGYLPRTRPQPKTARGFLGFVIEQLPFPIFSDIFYGEVIQGIEQEAHECGFTTGFAVIEGQRPDEARAKISQMLNGNRVRGLIAIGAGDLTDDLVAELAQARTPLVLIDNYLYQVPLDSIQMDHSVGGYIATQHLITLGHRRIACIAGPTKYKTLSDRLDGYCRAMRDAGLPLAPALIVYPPGLPGARKGYHEMQHLLALPERPSAVFAISDKTAFGALEALREAGLRAPDDLSIVGFDDVAEASVTTPPLTTVAVPREFMGRLAVRRLVELLNVVASGTVPAMPPIKTVVPVELIVRASTAGLSTVEVR